MEDVLVHAGKSNGEILTGLNPCCDGRCSSTAEDGMTGVMLVSVLILVVMEDVLVHFYPLDLCYFECCLNPCCDGRCSSTELYKTKLIINKLKNFTKQIFTFLNRKLTIS